MVEVVTYIRPYWCWIPLIGFLFRLQFTSTNDKQSHRTYVTIKHICSNKRASEFQVVKHNLMIDWIKNIPSIYYKNSSMLWSLKISCIAFITASAPGSSPVYNYNEPATYVISFYSKIIPAFTSHFSNQFSCYDWYDPRSII